VIEVQWRMRERVAWLPLRRRSTTRRSATHELGDRPAPNRRSARAPRPDRPCPGMRAVARGPEQCV